MFFKKFLNRTKNWACKKEKRFINYFNIFQVLLILQIIELIVRLIIPNDRLPGYLEVSGAELAENSYAFSVLIPNIFVMIFTYCVIHLVSVKAGYIPKTLFVKLHAFLRRTRNKNNTEEPMELEQDSQIKRKLKQIYCWDISWILISAIGFIFFFLLF